MNLLGIYNHAKYSKATVGFSPFKHTRERERTKTRYYSEAFYSKLCHFRRRGKKTHTHTNKKHDKIYNEENKATKIKCVYIPSPSHK